MDARVQGGEERTSFHVTLPRKMKVKHSGGEDLCFYHRKQHRIPSRGEKGLGFSTLFLGTSCHLCSPLFLTHTHRNTHYSVHFFSSTH